MNGNDDINPPYCSQCGGFHRQTTVGGCPATSLTNPPCLNCGGWHSYTINGQCPSLSETKTVTGPTLWPFKCPVCDGTGLVSRPPGVAGDQLYWSSSETGPYTCRACGGNAIIWGPPPLIIVPSETVVEGE